MQTVLITVSLLLLGTTLTLGAFAAAMRRDEDAPQSPPSPPRRFGSSTQGFFLEEDGLLPRDPVKRTLARIERHIRGERAAAERFLESPSGESLHAPAAPADPS